MSIRSEVVEAVFHALPDELRFHEEGARRLAEEVADALIAGRLVNTIESEVRTTLRTLRTVMEEAERQKLPPAVVEWLAEWHRRAQYEFGAGRL